MKAEFADLVDDFNEESNDLLDAMEESLLQIQESGMDSDNISAIFRAAHTIKGAGGLFELDYLVKFTHVAENLLDEIRNGKIEMSEPVVNLYFDVKDHMQTLVDWAVSQEEDPGEDINEMSAYLVEQLNFYLDGGDPNSTLESASDETQEQPMQEQSEQEQSIQEKTQEKEETNTPNPQEVSSVEVIKPQEIPISTGKESYFGVKLKFVNHSLLAGIDPLEFIKILKNSGSISKLKTDISEVPDLLNYSVDDTYLNFEFDLVHKIQKSKF